MLPGRAPVGTMTNVGSMGLSADLDQGHGAGGAPFDEGGCPFNVKPED